MPPRQTNKSKTSIPITSLKHADTRANIPTEELRGFVADEERTPKTVLYPRDPSLDPQLVWKGKDEQDQHPLEVPAVPIYIQEKIQPQAIIENVRSSPSSPISTVSPSKTWWISTITSRTGPTAWSWATACW